VLKKLLALVAALLISAVITLPASAQTADLSVDWGTPQWFDNVFGNVPGFCEDISESADSQAVWEAMFGPEIATWCGLTPVTEDTSE
jgi:hypothetical protein